MSQWTIDLADPGAASVARSGGKGAGLARLIGAGLPVPPGFAIVPEAMRAALGETPADLPLVWSDAAVRAEAQRRAELLRTAPLPPGLESEIRERLAALGDIAVAVRSSALDEDGAEHSAAGQHDTYLGVRGVEAVVTAVRAAWASVHGHRAAVYRARTGAAPFAAGAAIVVQAMAPAEIAGVVFTADPLSRSPDSLLVELARGSGAAVVGGTAEVQRIELARNGSARRLPAGALLDEAQLASLWKLALSAEAALGAPADVEWAWSAAKGFSLLQLRPITAAPARPHRRDGVIWTRRFSGERWTEPATPLGWSIVLPALARFTHWRWASRRYLRGSATARLHAGTPYFNVTIFRHLLFKTPWSPTPEFILELFPAEEQAEWRRRRWLFPTPGLVLLVVAEALLKARWRGHRWLWFTNPRDWQKLAPRISRAAAAIDRNPADATHAFEQLDVLLDWLDRYVGVHVWSLLWANLFYQVLGVLLERAGGPRLQRLRPALVAGEGAENLTLRTNAAVWRLAATAHEDPRVERALLEASRGESARAAIASLDTPGARHFSAALDALLERYGHRSRATWEVFSRRWRDEPGLVLEMVRGCLRAGISADPFLQQEEMLAARRAAEAQLDEAVARRPLRRALLRWALRHARVFSLLRENQRFVFDELMLAIGDLCRAAGKALEQGHRLADAGDALWLELEELRALSTSALSAPEAARRSAQRKAATAGAARTWAPTFLFEDEPAQSDAAQGPGRVLHGLGISPGRVTGRVRIARSLEDVARLERGEILVVRASDPGWTPYFSHAGALVTELGGLLSHAAVVAREYGLPAVANIDHATETLHEGEQVTVDGDEGTVSRS